MSNTNAKQAAIASAGLAFLNGVLLSAIAGGAESLIIAIEEKQKVIKNQIAPASVIQSITKGLVSSFANIKADGAEKKTPDTKKKAALPHAIVVVVAGILLVSSVMFCLIESMKVLSHPDIAKKNVPGESEETKEKRNLIKTLMWSAFAMQTAGQGVLQSVMAVSMQTRWMTPETSREKGIQALRRHVGAAAAVYFAMAGMMGYSAHLMQEANVGN